MIHDRQQISGFLSLLPEYYACLRMVYCRVEESRCKNSTVSMFDARRLFSRRWHEILRYSNGLDREAIFEIGNARARRAIYKHYNNQSPQSAK